MCCMNCTVWTEHMCTVWTIHICVYIYMYRGSNRVLWLPQPCRPSQPPSDPYPPFCSPSAPLPTSSPWHSLTRHLRVSSIFGSWLLFVCLFVYLLTYLCIKQQYSSLKKAYAKAQHVRGINKKKIVSRIPMTQFQALWNRAWAILLLFTPFWHYFLFVAPLWTLLSTFLFFFFFALIPTFYSYLEFSPSSLPHSHFLFTLITNSKRFLNKIKLN